MCEEPLSEKKDGVVYVQVENSAAAAGLIAHNFFDQPSEKMKVGGGNRNQWKNNDCYIII